MTKLSTRQKIWLGLSIVGLVAFVVFTMVVAWVDVNQVGLSHLNQAVWRQFGKSALWERITDWLGYLVILAVLGILAWQIWQWVQRKSLRRIDVNLIFFDIVVAVLVFVYIFFEIVIINYRPELDHGVAKASYPSSHAMLFATVLPLLIWQIWHYIKSKPWRIVLTVLLTVVMVVGVVGRLLSGVHWFTDIVAGMLVSCCLDALYLTLVSR